MRTARRLAALLVLGFTLLVVSAGGASAHPLGNFTINTYDGVVVVPGEVRVQYVLDMAEIPTFQLSHTLDRDGDGTASAAELGAFASSRASELVGHVEVRVNGRTVPLRVRSATAALRPGQAGLHCLRLEAVFAGRVGRTGTVSVADRTYADHIGWHEITAIGARGAVVTQSSVPERTISRALLRYPTDLLKNPLDVTRARFDFRPGASGAAPAAPGGGGGVGARPGVTGGAFARLATWSGLSIPALLLALALAAAFGAAHALLPGHGKTLMAAYLVGRGGRLRQAAQVGVAVAAMHSASVLALGLAILGLQVVAPDRIYPWVTLATGLLVVGMGVALVILRVRERRRGESEAHRHAWGHTHVQENGHGSEHQDHGHDHIHANGHGADRHDHVSMAAYVGAERVPALVRAGASTLERGASSRFNTHEIGDAPPGQGHGPGHMGNRDHGNGHRGTGDPGPQTLDRPLSRAGMASLAVAGGILPSPTAIVVLLATFSAHRIAFGLALILSFSAGMAAALVGVGILALRARGAIARRLSGRLLRVLPIATALVIVGVGLFLAVKGATAL
ncbi:MAG: hypothetical protein ACJ77A_03935 [Actinomycetota bacterium]